MKKIIVSTEVKKLSEKLSVDSFQNVQHYFPIDRFFIEENGYLEKIKSVDAIEFIFHNLESVNTNYTVQLLLCLPELWEGIWYEDIINLIENFTNSFSFYTLIGFTYQYLEIDLLDEIFYNENVDLKYKKDCADYFHRITATFYLSEYDMFEFNENLFGISLNDWNYTKQRLLSDKRVRPSLEIDDLYKKLKRIEQEFA